MQRARWCCLGGLLLSLLGSAVYGAEKGGSPPAAKLFHVRIRAVDARGRPIAGALIEAWHTGGEPGDFKVRRLVVNGANEIRSKADGWAVVSFSLVVKPATNRSLCTYFCFTAQATGHLVTRSGPIAAESSDRFEIVLTLRRLVSVEGRVVNRQGRPVADATVFHTGNATERTEVKTDSQGRFRLDGLPEGRPPIFVTHPAYHFYGQLADTSAKQQELRPLELDRSPPPLRTLPPLNSHEQELRLARRVIRRILESAEEGKKDRWNWQLYANLDPWYALEYVERHLSKEVKNPFACRAMPLLYPARPDNALAVLESIDCGEENKAWALIETVRQTPRLPREQKLDLLDRATQHARDNGPVRSSLVPQPHRAAVVRVGQGGRSEMDCGGGDSHSRAAPANR